VSVQLRLWQLLAVVAAATFVFGLGIGRYVVPKHEKPSLTEAFESLNTPDYQERSKESEAQTNVRAAIPALEAWNADHGSYAGATVQGLQAQYDTGLKNVSLVWAGATDYCVESTVGDATYHKQGPGAEIVSGACPRS
jgi:hypothetical protein